MDRPALARIRADELRGVRFAANVFLGATLLWLVLYHGFGLTPLWAIAAMISASEPVMTEARKQSRASLINTSVGCAVGLPVLLLIGPRELGLPIAAALSVLVSSYLVQVPTMWRQAPITAALVVASGLTTHSERIGVEQGLTRVGEVLLGCATGIAISWLMARLWPMPVHHNPD
jgi:uncharacterized membrane protein YccC